MTKTKKVKKVKNELVFDCAKREEFLKGFSKRKQQRKKKAAAENEQKLKAELKRIKDEVYRAIERPSTVLTQQFLLF